MGIKTFKELTKDMEIEYYTERIEEPIDLEIVLEQLDKVSGITEVEYARCFEEPHKKITIQLTPFLQDRDAKIRIGQLLEDKSMLDYIINQYRLRIKTERYALTPSWEKVEMCELFAARSSDEITLPNEIQRVARFIPAAYLIFFNDNKFGVLDTHNYEVTKTTPIPVKDIAEVQLEKKRTQTQYTSLQKYWNKEVIPVLIDNAHDVDKCKALTEFAVLVNSLAENITNYEENEIRRKVSKDDLTSARMAATNLVRAITLNSKKETSSIFMQPNCIPNLLYGVTKFNIDYKSD